MKGSTFYNYDPCVRVNFGSKSKICQMWGESWLELFCSPAEASVRNCPFFKAGPGFEKVERFGMCKSYSTNSKDVKSGWLRGYFCCIVEWCFHSLAFGSDSWGRKWSVHKIENGIVFKSWFLIKGQLELFCFPGRKKSKKTKFFSTLSPRRASGYKRVPKQHRMAFLITMTLFQDACSAEIHVF